MTCGELGAVIDSGDDASEQQLRSYTPAVIEAAGGPVTRAQQYAAAKGIAGACRQKDPEHVPFDEVVDIYSRPR